jgi:hypothetical protein
MTDEPEAKGPEAYRFKPGQSGNPAGRPKGARNKLGEAFVEALHDDFNANGVKAIERMRAEDPGGYVRVIAGLLPKEFKIETVSELTDEQLDARIRQLGAILNRLEGGAGVPAGGGEAPEGPQTAH